MQETKLGMSVFDHSLRMGRGRPLQRPSLSPSPLFSHSRLLNYTPGFLLRDEIKENV